MHPAGKAGANFDGDAAAGGKHGFPGGMHGFSSSGSPMDAQRAQDIFNMFFQGEDPFMLMGGGGGPGIRMQSMHFGGGMPGGMAGMGGMGGIPSEMMMMMGGMGGMGGIPSEMMMMMGGMG